MDKFAVVKDGVIVAMLPALPYFHENITGFNTLSPQEAIPYGFLPIEHIGEDQGDEFHTVSTSVRVEGDKVIVESAIEEIPLADAKRIAKAKVADRRFSKETRGVDVLGVHVATDRSSQSQLASTFMMLQAGLAQSVSWKGENGWLELTPQNILLVVGTVAGHVQGAFVEEKAKQAEIDALDSVAAIQLLHDAI